MKLNKILIILAILSMVTTFSFADDTFANSQVIGGKTINFSKNVLGIYIGGGTQEYTAAAFNPAGTKMYAVASGYSKVRYAECTDTPCTDAHTGVTAPTESGEDAISSWGDGDL